MKLKKHLPLILLGCLLAGCAATHNRTHTDNSAPATLRLMTYNTHNGIGTDGRTDYGRIAALITAVSPQVVALQELDSATTRSRGAYVLGELARLTGMNPLYAPAINYAGGKYGIGILCREQPLRVRQLPLPGREEERTLLIAEFSGYIFMATHLSLTAADAEQSARLIVQEAQAARKPVYLGGDLNSIPSSPAMQILKEQFALLTDTLWRTCEGSCIDYLCGPRAKYGAMQLSHRAMLPDSTASDHCPLYVEVRRR